MSRKKRGRKKKSNKRPAARQSYGHDHKTDDNFIDDLDHTAYHLAEDLRNLTDRWKKQGFAAVGMEQLPPVIMPLLKTAKDWERFGGYIQKWIVWWLRSDFPMPMVCGDAKVELVGANGEIRAVVFGYELQPETSQN